MLLSPLIRFGTSTWIYEGWQGQVYLKRYAKTTFARECLGEYCQYLKQIPEDFEMCFKVWEKITIPSYAKQARFGVKAGQPNSRFLDAKLFNHLVLTPYRDAKFEPHTGPFLFEFERHGWSSEEFCSRLNTFFSQLPRSFGTLWRSGILDCLGLSIKRS